MWQRYIIGIGGIFFGFIIHQWTYVGAVFPDPIATTARQGSWIGNRYSDPQILKLRGELKEIDVAAHTVSVDIVAYDGSIVPITARYDENVRIDLHARTDKDGVWDATKTTEGRFEDLKASTSVLVRMNADGEPFLAKTIAIYQ